MSNQVFVDSSVLVALLAKEPDCHDHLASLREASRRFTSPIALVETTMVLSSIMGTSPTVTEQAIRDFLAAHDVETISISDATASAAVRAFARYGKGRHAARLNIGDCFSYACAKEHRLTLLYKGGDFAQTDLA